jgi:hypothetical protein
LGICFVAPSTSMIVACEELIDEGNALPGPFAAQSQ